jgi:cytochrome d ubiquinol oxidase subunit I
MVAFGTLLSAFWILAANSWMQTPAGAVMENGIFFPVSWLQIIFNPSFPYRFAHTVVAFYVTTGFVVVGVAAHFLLRRRYIDEARAMLSATLWLLTLLVPLQILIGDQHGLNSFRYQPAKVAAIEAHWETQSRAPWVVFAWPDADAEVNRFAIEIPLAGSLILTHDVNGVVRGLKDFPRDERAPVVIPFFAFRIMLAIGGLFLLMVAVALWLRYRRRLYDSVYFLKACVAVSPLGFVAVIAGWTMTEVGRQPWTVYGLLRTADSVTPSLTGFDVLVSLIGYVIAYLVIFPAGIFFMARVVRHGPVDSNDALPVEGGRPREPITQAE